MGRRDLEFEEIIARLQGPMDRVEVIITPEDARLFNDLLCQYRIPASFAFGRPLLLSRPGDFNGDTKYDDDRLKQSVTIDTRGALRGPSHSKSVCREPAVLRLAKWWPIPPFPTKASRPGVAEKSFRIVPAVGWVHIPGLTGPALVG